MSLVDYSDSDFSEDALTAKRSVKSRESSPANSKKRCIRRGTQASSNSPSSLPPLPVQFRDLYAVSTRVSVQDDPALHGGRKRAIPHVVGNWPTHVYLEWYPTKKEIKTLSDIIARSKSSIENQTEVHSLIYSDLGVQLPLHISLSRPVVLATEGRYSFSDKLEKTIRDSDIRPFDLAVESLDWVSNFENTRWFLVLRVSEPANDALNCLLKTSNHTLSLFGQPPLYEGPSLSPQDNKPKRHKQEFAQQKQGDFSQCFHISIAWSLTEPSIEDKSRLKSLSLGELQDTPMHFDSIKIKMGNQILSCKLPTKAIEPTGLTGL